MRHLLLCFIFLIGTAGVQAQATPLPRDGEARGDRSEVATFWVSPAILQPSVFFDRQEVQQRNDRKWWRRPAGSPVPNLNYPLATTEEEWPQNPNLSHGALLYPISFGKDIPPVKPLWKEVSNYR